MKKRMLIIVSASLMLTLIIISGTYAWFTARVTSAGNEISTGTLLLNGGTDKEVSPLFTISNCQPGDRVEITPLIIKNTGTLDLKIKAGVSISYKNGDNDWAGDSSDNGSKKYFRIQPKVSINGEDKLDYTKDGQSMSLDEFKEELEEILNDVELKAAKSADGQNPAVPAGECIISGDVILDEQAGNDYQGLTVTVDITIDAGQIGYKTTTP